MKKSLKVVHIPFSGRNPYQKLLSDGLKACGIDVKGAPVQHFKNISVFNFSLVSLLFNHWKPDIVHLHWQSSFIHVEGSRFKAIVKARLFILQLLCLKAMGIKIVWTVHNLKRHEETFRDIERRYTKIMIHLSDGVIAHCQSAKQKIQSYFHLKDSNKIAVIPHGNFLNCYPNEIDRETATQKLGLRTVKTTFLFLGELRYYKGILDLIDAFKLLGNQDSQLVIAGRPHNDKIKDDVMTQIGNTENIIAHFSFVPDHDLQIYINASDVMVFPYRDIFTSGGIFLAMSFGKPIIAPNLGCISDTLNDTGNFLYVDEVGYDLSNALKETMTTTPDLLHEKGLANLCLAETFNWDDISEKTIKIYRKLLSSNHPEI